MKTILVVLRGLTALLYLAEMLTNAITTESHTMSTLNWLSIQLMPARLHAGAPTLPVGHR